jgi:uncharacterized protein (DUF433 family)
VTSLPLGPPIQRRPAYSVAEAARYLSIPTPTLRSWFSGIKDAFVPVIQWEDPEDRRLSFANLVEAHVLRGLRTKHGVSMPAVRKAIEYVEAEHDISRLLIHPGLRAASGRLFLQRYSELTELSRSGQFVLERAFAHHLEAIVQDAVGLPVRLYPWIPDSSVGPRKSVLIAPDISFGRPVTAGRGITTAVLADQYDSGSTIENLSEEYGLSTETIEDALAFERAAA